MNIAPQAMREVRLNQHCTCRHIARIHGTHAAPGRGACRACGCPDHQPVEGEIR